MDLSKHEVVLLKCSDWKVGRGVALGSIVSKPLNRQAEGSACLAKT